MLRRSYVWVSKSKQRSHRSMVTKIYTCRHCDSTDLVKNGKTRHGNQRCLCHNCGKTLVLIPKVSNVKQNEDQIVRSFRERLSLRGICRVFNISEGSVFKIFNKHSTDLPNFKQSIEPARADDVIELDEMWSFCTDKGNKQWIWTAICRRTRQIVAYVIGDRSKETFQRLLRKIPDDYLRCDSFSDYYAAYEMLLAKGNHKLVGKETGQTAHMERWNATVRCRVSRFVRKSLSFSRKLRYHHLFTKTFIWFYNLEHAINTL